MKKILPLGMAMFALGLDAYVIAGLFPFLSTSLHVGVPELGQTVTIFTLCYALSAPIFSTLLSKYPTRSILIIALIVFTLANIASALSSTFLSLLIARGIAGIGAGLFSPMASVAAVGLVSPEKKGRAIGLILGGMSIGTVVGVPLGLFIAQHSSWQNTFWFVTLISVLALIAIYLKFPMCTANAPPNIKERLSMLADRKVAATVAISLLTSISSLGLYTYLASILPDDATHSISAYLWAWGVGGIIGSFSIGYIIDRTGHPRIVLAALLSIMTLSIFLLPFCLHYSILGFIPLILWGAMGWSSLAPQQHALLSLQPKHGSIVVALNSSVNYLGSSIGAALGGVAIGFGLQSTYLPYLAGIIALSALLGQLLILNSSWQ